MLVAGSFNAADCHSAKDSLIEMEPYGWKENAMMKNEDYCKQTMFQIEMQRPVTFTRITTNVVF